MEFDSKAPPKRGQIVCVGTGMTLGAHMSPRCRSYIESADVVFAGVAHQFTELWLKELNANVISLQPLYAEGKDRRQTYQEMAETMMAEVRKGKNVVGAFYGHPGVFALAPHQVLAQAKMEGFYAIMEPGISAEACLYAHLGIDPGRLGIQHYETSQFMFYKRQIDLAAYLILWQVGIAGDTTTSQFSTTKKHLLVLVDLLKQHFDAKHQIALYECPALPTEEARIEWLALEELAEADVNQTSTLVVPPTKELEKNQQIYKQLKDLTELSNVE